MIAGVGIDLIEVDRMERALARRRGLAERIFTRAERGYAEKRARPAIHLAARFAAKEAVVKALGLTGFSFRDVEVVAGSPPIVRLGGRAAERAAELGVDLKISLTHTRDTAAAFAVAVTR